MENKKTNEILKLLTGYENINNKYKDLLKILENHKNYDLISKIIERVICEEEEKEKENQKGINTASLSKIKIEFENFMENVGDITVNKLTFEPKNDGLIHVFVEYDPMEF